MQSHRTAQPTGTANRRKASTKGEVNMNTPNTAELLVQQTEKATRLAVEVEQLRRQLQEVARLAKEAKGLDEFRQELDRLNQQK